MFQCQRPPAFPSKWTEWDLNPRLPPAEGGDLPLIYRPAVPDEPRPRLILYGARRPHLNPAAHVCLARRPRDPTLLGLHTCPRTRPAKRTPTAVHGPAPSVACNTRGKPGDPRPLG